MTDQAPEEYIGSTGIRVVLPDVPRGALDLAEEIAAHSGRRKDTPVRMVFVRDLDDEGAAPLAGLIDSGGRGGAVAVKLYLALIWRSSAEPFDTSIPARKWAELLGLDDPAGRGARRVTDALQTLEAHRLIQIEPQPGNPSKVYLREESGRGVKYTLPSTSYTWASQSKKINHLYFLVPTKLWTEGHIQSMSAPALAMLLICLSNNKASTGEPVWWSTTKFPARYGISPATRARGTRELVARRLLLVTKQLVNDSSTNPQAFARERVRNVYQLIGDAQRRVRLAPKRVPAAKKVLPRRRKTGGAVVSTKATAPSRTPRTTARKRID